ncbi:MAG: cyclic nucleotide-binding domain-containing protein [SAR324 cluster bacterium]|nr:cyclic nucleotide-binding domain-containing protein [SAR324 cluster bacterium]
MQSPLPLKVLLVTNNKDSRSMVQDTLTKLNVCNVHHAETPQKGIDLLNQHSIYDLSIVDEFNLGGNALIKAWVHRPHLRNIPMILMTEEVSLFKLQMYRRNYIRHVLIKPFDSSTFFQKFENVLRLGEHFSPEYINKIRKIDFFSHFKLCDLYQILETGFIKEFQAGSTLIHESGKVNKFGVILKGEAGIYRTDKEGNSTEVSTLKKGDFLGETNLLSSEHSSTRIVAHTNSIVFMMPNYAFQLFPEKLRDQFYQLIILNLTKKLRYMTDVACEEKNKVFQNYRSQPTPPPFSDTWGAHTTGFVPSYF